MSGNTVVWLHEGSLSPKSNAPAVYVFDEGIMEEDAATFKQVVFIYECLMEIPTVSIRKGETVATVLDFARKNGADRVVVAHSVAPRFARLCERLREAGLEVEVVGSPEFVAAPEDLDLKRFSRYWRKVTKSAMRPGGRP